MLQLKAYAKINLSLRVIGLRPDGYHAIESVMQSISLHDRIVLEPAALSIQLTTDNPELPTDERNLAFKAAKTLLERTGHQRGVKIQLEKKIPLGAGLAGGSADAAAVLFGLNLMLGRPLSGAELLSVGAQVGSDVPFCLTGGNCLVTGRGERIEIKAARGGNYVLVVPPLEVSTKWAYGAWDEENLKVKDQNLKLMNDLEPIVIKKYPVIQKVKNRLLELGCSTAQMSGSGSSVFGTVDDPGQGEKIAALLKTEFPNSYFVTAVDRGIEGIA